jgi:flagellar motor protein MotB
MARWTGWIAALAGGLMLSGIVGCGPKKPVEMVTPQVDTSAWERQIKDLTDRLRAAEADRDRNAARIAQLQQQLADAQRKLAEKPEPAPAPGWQNVPGGAMTSIEGTVLFDSGKAVFKPGAKETLDQVARVITEKYPDYDIYVVGNTDNVPIQYSPWKDNLELSVQRALTVTRYLRGALRADNVAAAGWGAARPVADNNTAQGRQENRRVEIYAMRPEETPEGGELRTSPPRGAAPRVAPGEEPVTTPREAPAGAAPRTAPRTTPRPAPRTP